MRRGRSEIPPDYRPDGQPPSHMSAAERLDEVAEILALGVVRLRARQGKPNCPNHLRGFGLDFRPEGSVCGLEPDHGGERR